MNVNISRVQNVAIDLWTDFQLNILERIKFERVGLPWKKLPEYTSTWNRGCPNYGHFLHCCQIRHFLPILHLIPSIQKFNSTDFRHGKSLFACWEGLDSLFEKLNVNYPFSLILIEKVAPLSVTAADIQSFDIHIGKLQSLPFPE